MIVSFATAENTEASDGDEHSPYALALSKFMKQSLPIETYFRRVGGEVLSSSGQRPMLKNSFYGRFSFGSSGGDNGGHDMRGITKIGDLMYQNQPFSELDTKNFDTGKYGDRTYSWEKAKGYCQALKLGDYNDWRVPTKKELTALGNVQYHNWENYDTWQKEDIWKTWYKKNKYKELKNTKGNTFFIRKEFLENMPNMNKFKEAFFWSSEATANNGWRIDFHYGYEQLGYKEHSGYVLCVR